MRGGAAGALQGFKPRATAPQNRPGTLCAKTSRTAKTHMAAAAFLGTESCYGKNGYFRGACWCLLHSGPRDAARVGATDPSHGRRLCHSVPLHLSNGVYGIFLLSPLCCRKREVREPQAPAPVLQVTQPFSLPKIPPSKQTRPKSRQPLSMPGLLPARALLSQRCPARCAGVPLCRAGVAGTAPHLRLLVGLAV